jgi:3-phenylpropionate/trans-cinnamate dioxygenase ferredoxin reductase subunit
MSAPRRGAGTSTPPRQVVVVGASLAGLRAAEALRQAGFDGRLTIVGEETHPPYNRPPLTKAALAEGPDVSVLSFPSADGLDATWALGVSATGLDLTAREVQLDNGGTVPFEGLVIASGARARRLTSEVGGVGVHHVRTIDDAAVLHQALAAPEQRVLVIGAGFLGCEVASTAASLGHSVTLIEATAGPMLGALGPELSTYAAGLHRSRGVDLRTSTTVESLTASDGARQQVAVLADHTNGRRSAAPADIVVAALGATPSTDWLRGSGLDITDGVATDLSLTALDTTGIPVAGVVAVGDVARVPQPLLEGTAASRVEHWATAVGHSRIAAATLISNELPARAVLPSFWTDQHGVQIRGIGLPGSADTTTIVDGAMEDHRFVVARTRRGRLVGVVAVCDTPALFRYRAELETASTIPQPTH